MDEARRNPRRWRLKLVLACAAVACLAAPWLITTYRTALVRKEIRSLNGLARSTFDFGQRILGAPIQFSFGPVESVYFLGPQLDDAKLNILSKTPALRILHLANTRVTDDGLAELAQLQQLNYLCISNMDYTKLIGPNGAKLNTTPLITGKGLVKLRDLSHLEVVQFSGSGFTDQDLRGLRELKHLVLIDLVGSSVTDAGVAEFRTASPQCQVRIR
jgi:hypothetical protein